MPTYEFQCDKCEEVFELRLGMNEEEHPDTCMNDDCDGNLEKLISGGMGIVFRGPGFYSTRNRDLNWAKDRQIDEDE